jgi:hypothetical protein
MGEELPDNRENHPILWRRAVDEIFPADANPGDPHGRAKQCLREIFLASYLYDWRLFRNVGKDFLRKAARLVDENKLADALMLQIPLDYPDVEPLINQALCFSSKSYSDPSVSCSKYACELLILLGKKERKRFFEECSCITGGEKDNIKECMSAIFNSPEFAKLETTCINFLDFLMNIDTDECLLLLTAKDYNGKTIINYMRTVKDEGIKKAYNTLIEKHKLGDQFRP